MASGDSKSAKPAKKQFTQEQIIAGFNQLRTEQRTLAAKVVELESDQNEHKWVVPCPVGCIDEFTYCQRLI